MRRQASPVRPLCVAVSRQQHAGVAVGKVRLFNGTHLQAQYAVSQILSAEVGCGRAGIARYIYAGNKEQSRQTRLPSRQGQQNRRDSRKRQFNSNTLYGRRQNQNRKHRKKGVNNKISADRKTARKANLNRFHAVFFVCGKQYGSADSTKFKELKLWKQ